MRRAASLMWGAVLAAQMMAAPAALPSETDRLVATGRLWITVRLFCPVLAHGDVNWDQALVTALPKIRSAQSMTEYEAAVRAMIQGLGNASPVAGGAAQRVLIHHGFAAEQAEGSASDDFYSAFLYKRNGAVEQATVPMGGFAVTVPLSEAASTGSPIPAKAIASVDGGEYPAVELRILAAYKVWGILRYFFAYRDLMDEDWDGLFPQFLTRVIAAKDALEYNLAIAEWLTHAADTFTRPESATLRKYFGEAPVGLRVRIVEKHVTVSEVLDPEAEKAGIKVGDVVKKVDGETLVDRFKRLEKYIPASTSQRLGMDVVERILDGPDGSSSELSMEDHAGNRKDVTLKRSVRFREAMESPVAGTAGMKTLRGGVGYADLRKLGCGEIDGMFERFEKAPAIVFDMRGVSKDDCGRTIAAHLTSEEDVPAVIVTGLVATTPDLPREAISSPSASYFFIETTGKPAQHTYKGRTVLLVDERTIGLGEKTGLFLEAANKTELVGSASAGAYTAITKFTLPGGIEVSFSGEDCRHANGGKLQRLGLQPQVTVTPTLNGIRTGKDEVLEKALDEVLPGPPSPKAIPSRASI